MSIDDMKRDRLRKFDLLEKNNINVFPSKANITHHINEVISSFNSLLESQTNITLAGRIMALRSHGNSIFLDIYDGTDRLQVYLKKDVVGDEKFKLFDKTIDIGDLVEVSGILFITQKEEQSLKADDWRILAKSLRPLPDKWHGLQDPEEKFRKRYLDILMDEDIRNLFIKKAKFWDVTREFLKEEGFLEVETPTLEVTTGGAEATPFRTYHEDFNLDVFLRISIGELWQKKLMAAGILRTFEIGRAYRNEGTDMNHVQEFTNMEFYMAYANYKDGMELVQRMYRKIAQEVFGTTKFETRGHTFDLSGEWPKIDYREAILKETDIDILKASQGEIEKKLQELKVEYDGVTRERMIDTLWKYCRKKISGPVFLVNHPKIVSPLAKSMPENPELTERFQIIIAGSEVGNGYSELNNPIDQRERFEAQQKFLEEGDREAMMPDWEFVEMLEYGMPPTCGFGFGEMLFAFLVDRPIRETQIFPLMKPKLDASDKKSDKPTDIAVVVLNNEANLEPWQVLNTVSHLNAAFGAREGKRLFFAPNMKTKDGKTVNFNIADAIMIKSGKNSKELQKLAGLAREEGLRIEEFIRPMIETSDDKKLVDFVASHNLDEIEYLGVLLFGKKSQVETMTKKFELYK
jgi:lysyl-tRNA synthetase class 2